MNSPSQRGGGTRDKILVASARLFTERGYVGTTTRDIADVVGISQPGLYRHFPAKADIYLALADEILQPWLSSAQQAQHLDVSPAHQLLWLLNRICWACAASPYEFAFLLTNSTATDSRLDAPRETYDQVLKLMRNVVQDGINQAQFRPVDVDIALHLCMSLTDLLIFPTAGSAEDKINEILALTAFGLIQERAVANEALAWVSTEDN
ncbi:MAG: TetR/AcrR family transcriptional regulator [Pseudomonadota bacterium]